MTTYLQRLPKIQKYFHKTHINGKRIVSRGYDCTTNKLLRKTTKKFSQKEQFFPPKILNIYVDVKTSANKIHGIYAIIQSPCKQREKDIMLSFIA